MSIITAGAQNSFVTVRVKFAGTPTSASSSFADLKYDKQGFYNIEVDDNSADFRNLMNYFQGGVVTFDGQTYPGKFYTDGCGNLVPYTASIAINVRSHHWPPNQQDGMLVMESDNPNNIEIADLVKAVQTGCYPAVHGYYHNMEGYYIQNNFTQAKNISECASYIWQKTQFISRVFITPNADAGYNPFLEAQGYFGNSSTGVTDGYPQSPTPQNIWTTGLSDVTEADNGSFRAYLRDFLDGWKADPVTLGNMKNAVTALKNASNTNTHKFRRIGTHGFSGDNWPYFKTFIEHIETTSQDAIWVTTLQEALEYLETKRKLVKTETLQGNELVIQLDYTGIPTVNLIRDISLKINSDAAIESITVGGAQRSTYNLNSGLINVFNKRSTAAAPLGVLPLKLVSFTCSPEQAFNIIKWQTANELGIDHIEIERSNDGVQFTKLGQTKAKGGASSSYSFEDRQVINEAKVYYRLKMVDQDGTFRYSNVVALKRIKKDFSMSVTPNPVRHQIILQVEAMANENATAILVNNQGQVVFTQKLQLFAGSSVYQLSNPDLQKGSYTLKVLRQDGKNTNVKCVVL